MEHVTKLVILVILLRASSSLATEDNFAESNRYPAETAQGRRTLFVGDKTVRLRRGNENRSDFIKKQSKWRNEEARKAADKMEEEELLRLASRDGLISKREKKPKREEDNFDLYNMKNLNNEKEPLLQLRNDDGSTPHRTQARDDLEEVAPPARGRKPKKHGSGGFIPLPPPKERKPNIILILTDDQDVELGSLNFMPHTLRLLRDGGAEFRHAYVTTPMCCPSRSSLLTGMYVHNHNVFTNNENCSSIQWQQTHETRTFATYLSNAGYRTGYFGKYLNKYNGSYIPPGWREWGGLIMNSRYYNYSINMNGKKIKHGFDYHKDYYTDLIANDSVAFLRQSKQYFSRKPVMLVLSFPAPHGPEDSAPQFSDMFFNVTTHHTPAYDFAPNPDKQWILQVTNKMQDIHKQFTDMLMTKRLQTLQSVDSAVERIYQELKNIGELENTYIVYTSDHGYHLGQFGLVKGKSFPFEFDVRVPFLVRGPGVEPGTVVDDIVLNIDLAPTFLDIAGVEPPPHMDGRSVLKLLHHRPNKRRKIKWPDTFLIESSGRRDVQEPPTDTKKWRHIKMTPLRTEKEKNDSAVPEQTFTEDDLLETIIQWTTESTESVTKQTSEDSFEITADVGENGDDDAEMEGVEDIHLPLLPILSPSDTQVDNKLSPIMQPFSHAVPKLARLAMECQQPDMQSPCQAGQKWHCVSDGTRWRKHKCKFQRKCACFTPNGFIYTRLEDDDRRTRKLMLREETPRSKRSVYFTRLSQEIFQAAGEEALLSFVMRSDKIQHRKRRETDEEHISSILEDLEGELSETEDVERFLNATIAFGEEPGMADCSVNSHGEVNCTNIIYTDYNTWVRSREQIEMRIRNLRIELEALKEVRKHLKEKRPPSPATSMDVQLTTMQSSLGFNESETKPSTLKPFSGYSDTTDYISSFSPTRDTGDADGSVTTEFPDNRFIEWDSKTTDVPVVTEQTTEQGSENKVPLSHGWNRSDGNEDGSVNRIDGSLVAISRSRDKCVCAPDGHVLLSKKDEKELTKEARRRLKEERTRKRERKLKRKGKLEKECLSEKMNCFNHDNEHWRTPPLWKEGPFCFCMNANNNTYSCLRTINATHNYLYCEFITGFKTFYNLRIDPFEQLNRIYALSSEELSYLSSQLAELMACKGTRQCTLGPGRESYLGHYTPRVNRDLLR